MIVPLVEGLFVVLAWVTAPVVVLGMAVEAVAVVGDWLHNRRAGA